MPHETKLIALIAVGFVLALGFGFIAAKLRLPPLSVTLKPLAFRTIDPLTRWVEKRPCLQDFCNARIC